MGFSKKLKMSFTVCSSLDSVRSRISLALPDLVGDFASERGEAGRDSAAAAARPRRGIVGSSMQLDVQAERLELLDEHVEDSRAGPASSVCSPLTIASYMRVRPMHVVGLDGEELLQRVGRAVGFHRPDFHLAEALAAELRLAAERLLGDERVRPDRARVDLVVDEVVELEHVHDAHGDVVVERLAGRPSNSTRLAVERQAGHARARP